MTPGSPAVRDWRCVDISIAVDTSDWNYGTALFDSGLSASYIRFDEQTTAQLHTTPVSENNNTYRVLTNSSTIKMRVGKGPDYIGNYTVRVDDTKNAVKTV